MLADNDDDHNRDGGNFEDEDLDADADGRFTLRGYKLEYWEDSGTVTSPVSDS